jgi:response regulator RpfG family c-di-GMP phosphodiesterase
MNTEAKPTTLFYVDDDSDDRMFFEEAIAEIGENVQLFELGDDMLSKLKNPPPKPSIVFIDLNMPGKNGFELIAEIRASRVFKDLPLVIYSTTGDRDTVQKCLDLGASFYITKVITLKALKKAIETVVAIDWETFKPDINSFIYKH